MGGVSGAGAYLDDRSGRAAHEAGHIPGAIHVDVDTDLSSPSDPGGRHPLPSPEAFAATMARLGIGEGDTVVAYDDAGGATPGWCGCCGSPAHRAALLDGGIAGSRPR